MNKLSEIDYRAILQESYCQDFRTAIHNFVDNEERMYRLFNNVKAKELPTNIRMHKKLADKFCILMYRVPNLTILKLLILM